MKSETMINHVDQLERTRNLLDAVEGMPSYHRAAMMSRIVKDLVAGKISAAEVNEMRKAANV